MKTEDKRLKEIVINDVSLSHTDNYNFTITQGTNKYFFGSLKTALRRFYMIIHNGELPKDFIGYAEGFSSTGPKDDLSKLKIEHIKKALKGY